MGRSPCCDKVGLKKGPWTPEEDQKLLAYIEEHGHGSWRALPAKAGLQRCGKSCRLRWTNYLRPDIKRGKFSLQEEQTIIQLHALLGNRWSAIATHLPKRTDNEIKNYWNTHLKKRLAKMGIDPVTHKPKNDALLSNDGQSKNAATLSHMAQWESARLEAEARLVRESKLRSYSLQQHNSAPPPPPPPPPFPPLLNKPTWNPTNDTTNMISSVVDFVRTASGSSDAGMIKDEGEQDWRNIANSTSDLCEYKYSVESSLPFTSSLHDHLSMSMEGAAWSTSSAPDHHSLKVNSAEEHLHVNNAVDEGFTNLLLSDSIDRSLSDNGKDNNSDNSCGGCSDYYEDNKNYWNSILNLVNCSPSDSPMF